MNTILPESKGLRRLPKRLKLAEGDREQSSGVAGALADAVSAELADAGPLEVAEGGARNETRTAVSEACTPQTFIPVGNCSAAGEEAEWGLERLCGSCGGVFMLRSGCYPTFLNAVKCDVAAPGCLYDWWTRRAHGSCRSSEVELRVLRQTRDERGCESWLEQSVRVPVACQCLLYSASFLHTTP